MLLPVCVCRLIISVASVAGAAAQPWQTCVQGVDQGYDEAEAAVTACEAELAKYLKQIRQQLRAGQDLCYVTVNKDANLLEIPQVSGDAINLQHCLLQHAYQAHVLNLCTCIARMSMQWML